MGGHGADHVGLVADLGCAGIGWPAVGLCGAAGYHVGGHEAMQAGGGRSRRWRPAGCAPGRQAHPRRGSPRRRRSAACVNGGAIMHHARRPDYPVAAAQKCAIYSPLLAVAGAGDVRRGALCSGSAGGCRRGIEPSRGGRRFGIDRRTVKKMLRYSAPPGYRRTAPVRRPKLEGFTGIIDAILEADRDVPRKQRHTAQRIFERLRDEHGFTGGATIVRTMRARGGSRRARPSCRCITRRGMPRSTSARRWWSCGGVGRRSPSSA